MSLLGWVILAFMGGISVAGIVIAYAIAKKSGDPLVSAWTKIRPIISEAFVEAVKIYQANQIGYDALVEYCTLYVKKAIDEADYLLPAEKDALTSDFIRGILEPQLRKIWDEKMLSQI